MGRGGTSGRRIKAGNAGPRNPKFTVMEKLGIGFDTERQIWKIYGLPGAYCLSLTDYQQRNAVIVHQASGRTSTHEVERYESYCVDWRRRIVVIRLAKS